MKILHLISSPRGAMSASIKLGNAIVEEIELAHPGSTVKTHDLSKTQFPHLEESHLNSFFTPAESRTPEQVEAIRHSDEAIAELKEADAIVIGVPMYNFNIHSTLKAWIDHVVRSGITFGMGENGPHGLLHDKKVYLAISAGFIYTEGPMESFNFIEPYLRKVLGFIGLTDVTAFWAEGLSAPGILEKGLEKAIESIEL